MIGVFYLFTSDGL